MQHLQKTRGTSFKPKVSSLHTFPAVRTFKRVDVQTFQRVSSLSPIFRTLFQVPYPASPLFGTLTKTAGVCANNSQCGKFPLHSKGTLSPRLDSSSFFSHSCALFCTEKNS